MDIENTLDLNDWVTKKSLKMNDEDFIHEVIRAFSEYVTAVDVDYQYNKTFLNGFIDDFIESTKMLQRKSECISIILNGLDDYKNCIEVRIDNAWIYNGAKGKTVLSNSFNKTAVNSSYVCYQIKHLNAPTFVIADSIKMETFESKMEEVFNLFNTRLEKEYENKGL